MPFALGRTHYIWKYHLCYTNKDKNFMISNSFLLQYAFL